MEKINNPTDEGIFNSPAELRKLCERPVNVDQEPMSNFPLGYYELFLQEIQKLNIEILTYRDLFSDCPDWDYTSFYEKEFEHWKKHRDPGKTYLIIQHDIDNHPAFTRRMVAMEALYGVKSNIFMFCERYARDDRDRTYDIDHEFFREAEKQGFVIGYHQNAFALSGFNMDAAIERYREDVRQLRKIYKIEFVVPHGGVGAVIDDKKLHNIDVPMPDEFKRNLRWVFNRYGVRFDRKWSDGGLRKARDIERIKSFDLVNSFLRQLKKGGRYFCLIHPQRWGFNINQEQNPLLSKEKWYQDICRDYL